MRSVIHFNIEYHYGLGNINAHFFFSERHACTIFLNCAYRREKLALKFNCAMLTGNKMLNLLIFNI